MSGERGSRPETDALDYFSNQRKQLAVADRRPVIRRASDLVGPGINASAIRITDFNNLLATFNGYYSAAAGALGSPDSAATFVGVVAMDSEYGGTQTFTRMSDGEVYTRVFRRQPGSPTTIEWGEWTKATDKVIASGLMMGYAGSSAAIPTGWLLCNGQAVSRTVYAKLFAAIGTTFGVGNGSTTFNLPDYRNRSPYGANTDADRGVVKGLASQALTINHIPQHSHAVGTLAVSAQGDHTHGAGSYSAQSAGNHSHDITKGESAGSSGTTLGRGNATVASTGTGGIASNGAHTHTIQGLSSADGGHVHTLSGATANAGSASPTPIDMWQPSIGGHMLIKI